MIILAFTLFFIVVDVTKLIVLCRFMYEYITIVVNSDVRAINIQNG
jgi:hypothetical protein